MMINWMMQSHTFADRMVATLYHPDGYFYQLSYKQGGPGEKIAIFKPKKK